MCSYSLEKLEEAPNSIVASFIFCKVHSTDRFMLCNSEYFIVRDNVHPLTTYF